MIEIGTVTAHASGGLVSVEFTHIGTSAECQVLQSTTGQNTTYVMPSVGTQVVCWIESGKNIALGAIFSDDDKTPDGVSEKGVLYSIGNTQFGIDNEKVTFENASTSLLKVLEEILDTLKKLQVTTPQGPGTIDQPSAEALITPIKTKLQNLLK